MYGVLYGGFLYTSNCGMVPLSAQRGCSSGRRNPAITSITTSPLNTTNLTTLTPRSSFGA
ncbi:hypothetical protein E2C01_027319 [Portunus trituberculatus]|uniref:Uncharacterized protein n=1 Tax=Portunus trituberculatus TaxID=210409 RepID=A0A5B7ELC1_PORTR|nr:hypothetical protein [Portunus trituberculatus]